ncbi:B-box zinc finger protein 21 [Linum perenne]
MKIQCDVCEKEEAAVYCTADEAALCEACDHRVHHANKLASKHLRFSLLLPDPKSFPLCDVCQEKRAFLFCQQDRAILCQDCDVPIHGANEFTHHHNRFLLTGVKLSPTSQLYISPSSATAGGSNLVPTITTKSTTTPPPLKKPVSLSVDVANSNNNNGQPQPPNNNSSANSFSSQNSAAINNSSRSVGANKDNNNNMLVAGEGGGGYSSVHTSSISEYLIDMLPGWHVEDFLQQTPSSVPFGFCEPDEQGFMTGGGNLMSQFSSESSGLWVPQAQTAHDQFPTYNDEPPQIVTMQNGFKETKNQQASKGNNKRWTLDDVFAVPQISPTPTANKRSRLLWQ